MDPAHPGQRVANPAAALAEWLAAQLYENNQDALIEQAKVRNANNANEVLDVWKS
jgi:hypothetical protein